MELEVGFRYVRCYCKRTEVVSRRDWSFDKYAVCSRECHDAMVRDGNAEPGSLLRERHG